jgi:hypothetical protein
VIDGQKAVHPILLSLSLLDFVSDYRMVTLRYNFLTGQRADWRGDISRTERRMEAATCLIAGERRPCADGDNADRLRIIDGIYALYSAINKLFVSVMGQLPISEAGNREMKLGRWIQGVATTFNYGQLRSGALVSTPCWERDQQLCGGLSARGTGNRIFAAT